MIDLSVNIKLNEALYQKDPNSSELGKMIVSESIVMLSELGLEKFTFKKLGIKIQSPESTIYRYFKNKQMLLNYLTCWYWSWIEYKIVFSTMNIADPKRKLKIALTVLTEEVVEDSSFSHIDEVLLNRIIVTESAKTYLNKNVDKENEKGFFLAYKSVVQRVSDFVLEIKSDFLYPHMLISTVIEGAHHQRFFKEHLPRLTDTFDGIDAVSEFYQMLVFKILNIYET